MATARSASTRAWSRDRSPRTDHAERLIAHHEALADAHRGAAKAFRAEAPPGRAGMAHRERAANHEDRARDHDRAARAAARSLDAAERSANRAYSASAFTHRDDEPTRGHLERASRSHYAAAEAAERAGLLHEARHHEIIANKLDARAEHHGQHNPSPENPAPTQTGKKGGTFVVSASGKKRYVRK